MSDRQADAPRRRHVHRPIDVSAPWLDVRAAAQRALVGQATVLRAARRGHLEGYKISTGRGGWRFTPDAVDRWVMCAHPREAA